MLRIQGDLRAGISRRVGLEPAVAEWAEKKREIC